MRTVQLLLLSLVAINCATLKEGAQAVIGKLNSMDQQNDYDKQFFGLLQLKLEQGSKIDDVLSHIQELLDSLKTDKQSDDLEHAQQTAQYTVDIELLQYQVSKMSANLADSNNLLVTLEETLNSLKGSIGNYEKQLEILNTKEEELRKVRGIDNLAFLRRQGSNDKVLAALNRIIDMLSKAVLSEGKNTSLIEQRQTILAQLNEQLGNDHPITILVAVTTQFDVPTVKRIIQKLEVIRDGVIASIADDQTNEVNGVALFETVITDLSELRKTMNFDLADSRRKFQFNTKNKVLAQRTKDRLSIDLPNSQETLSRTKNASEQYESAYLQRSRERNQQITVVQQAYDVVKGEYEASQRAAALAKSLE